MIIKKWSLNVDGQGNNGWVNQAPKTTAANIYTTTGFAQSLFDANNKLKTEFLPDVAFGGLEFVTTIDNDSFATTGSFDGQKLVDLIHGRIDATSQKQVLGDYWVASETINIIGDTAKLQGTGAPLSKYYCVSFLANKEEDNATVTLEKGDWLVASTFGGSGTEADPWLVGLSVINNTYQSATSLKFGVIKLFSDTAQSVAANTVTAVASRTYGVQNNGSGQAVVNVPWENTTYSTATNSALGLIKVSSTANTQTLQSVTTTSNRQYAVQVDANGVASVNIPWVDTSLSQSDVFSYVCAMVVGGQGITSTHDAGAFTDTLSLTYPVYHGDTLPTLSNDASYDNVIGFEW